MANPGAFDAGSVEVRLGADVDESGFNEYDRAVERARRHRAVETELGAKVDQAAFAEYDRALNRAHEKAKRREAFKAALGGDYDGRAFREFERALDKARAERDVKKELKLDVDSGGFGGWIRNLRTARGESDGFAASTFKLGLTLRGIGWGSLAVSIGPLIAGLGALAAAATEAIAGLAPLGGLIATLPQFAAAAGQGLGVLALAGTGVVQTLKAMQAVDKGAAQQAQSSASSRRSAAASITSAQRSQADATRGVHDAQTQLTDAERQARFARQDLTKAEHDAVEQLKQLRFQAQDAAIAEKGATLSLAEARDHLRQVREDPNASAFDVADAQQQLAEAKQARVEAIDQSRTTRNALEHARSAGLNQMPDVIQARRQYADAERAVKQAADGVARAELAQRRATQDLAAAQAGAAIGAKKQTAAQSEYQRQLKQLDPAARAFVLRLKDLKGTGLELTHAAQSGFFPGALKGLNSALPLLGRAKTAIHETAGVLGGLTAKAGEFLGSKGFGRDFSQITHENAVLLERAGESGGHLFKALVNLTIAAQPLTDWISKLVLGWSKSIDTMTAVGRKNGDLQKFFAETKHVLQDVIHIVGGLGGALAGVFKAAYPFGRQMLDGLAKSAGKLNDLVNSVKGQNALRDFFRNAQAPLHELWLGLGDLAKAIGALFNKQLLSAMATILHALRVNVIPALATIADTLGKTVVPAAAKAIGAVSKLLKDMAPGLKPLLSALGTLIDAFTAAVKFTDRITQTLPGVLKLLPPLLLAGATFAGWKTLLGFIGRAKSGLLGLPPLGGGGAGGGGTSRIGRLINGIPIAGTIVLGSAALGTEIGKSARQTNSLGLPGSGGFLGGAKRSIFETTGLGLSDPEKAVRHFGDTARTTFERLKRLGDGRGLENLAQQAEAWARKEPKYAAAFLDFSDTVRKAARDVGGSVVARLEREINSHKFQTEPAIFKQIRGEFDRLSPQARIAGAKSMIDLSRSLEVQGRLPKGSTNRLIKDLAGRYNDLIPALRTSGHNSMAALNREFRDKKVVQTVSKQIDDISHTWGDAPKLAKTNAVNARQNWLKEMEFLRQKLKTTHGKMHDEAKAEYNRLKKLGPAAAKVERDEMLRTSTDLRGKWKDGLDKLVAATGNSMKDLTHTVGKGMSAVEKTLNGALKGLGIKPISFGIGASVNSGVNDINSALHAVTKAEGGWIGMPGQRGQDEIPMLANAGDAILNGQQQDILNLGFMRLGLGPMFARGGRLSRLLARATGGRVPIIAGAGEFHATPDMYPMLEMASQAAIGGGLDQLFGDYNTPHWAYARGGLLRRATGGFATKDYRGSPNFHLSATQVDAVRKAVGLPPIFDWVAYAESADRPGVVNGIGATGLWQIYNHPDLVRRFGSMTVPIHNAQAARVLYQQSGLAPWVSSRSGWAGHSGPRLGGAAGTVPGGFGVGVPTFHPIKTPGLTGPDGVLKGVGQGTLDKVTAAANKFGKAKTAAAAAAAAVTGAAGAVAGGFSFGPSGVGTFQGVRVANWIITVLRWAQQHGWRGHITSGYRPGFDPHTASGRSEHQGTKYPHGAVDVGGYGAHAEGAALWRVLSRYRGPYHLGWSGSHFSPPDWGHFSATGHQRGGFVGYDEGGIVGAGAAGVSKSAVNAAANASQRLERAINIAELFWSHTHGFNYQTPRNRRGRIHWGNAGGSYTGYTTGTPGSHASSRHTIIDNSRRKSPWGVLARTVTHEYGHLLGYKHQGGPSNIMMGGKPPAGRYPWTAKFGESWAASHGWGTRGPANLGIPIPLDKVPAWWKRLHGQTPTGGGGGGGGSTGPVSASGRKPFRDANFVTWRYPTQHELDEWYGKAKTSSKQKGHAGGRGSSNTKWHRVGATLDPTQGNPGMRGSAHGGFSYAELLEAGTNKGLHRFDLRHTLGVKASDGYGTGLPNQFPLWIRMPGRSKTHKIYKNDVGSGQAGNRHYKIDLHSAIAHALGWHPNGDVEVARAKARGGFLGRAARRFAGGGFITRGGTSQGQGTGAIAVDPVRGTATSGGGRSGPRNQATIPIADMSTAVKHWQPGIRKWTNEVAKLERQYSRRERVITRDDSRLEYVVSPADGSPAHLNQAAIDQRTKHLNELIDLKAKIRHAYWKLRQAIEYLRKAYRDTIAKLRAQLKFITSKLRRTAVLNQIKDYVARKDELTTQWQEADDNYWSAGQDVLDLTQERDVLLPDAQQQVSDTAGSLSEDQQAILDQAKQRIAVLQEAVRVNEGTIAAFRSPGDITVGAPSAYAAAFDLPGVGQGNVWGGAAGPYGTPANPMGAASGVPGAGGMVGAQVLNGLAPGVPYIVKVLPIDDPQGQQQLAGAVNAGNGYQGYQASPIEVPGL